MAVNRPILALGPRGSHIADIVLNDSIGWHVEHGDVAGAVTTMRQIADLSPDVLRAMGERAGQVVHERFSAQMRQRFCDLLEIDDKRVS
jgi:hypothetical protein